MRHSVRVLLLLSSAAVLNAFSLAADSLAQTQTAMVSGVVTDPRGAVIAGAQIAATQNPPSGETERATSGSDGQYHLALPPGHYRLTVSRNSFATAEQEIVVTGGETREMQIHLALEPLSSSVVVTAQTLPLDADSSPAPVTILTRTDIDDRVATSLPDLLATQAGFSLGRTGPEGGSTSLFLDGGNSNYTKVLVDGAPVNQPGGLIDFSNFTLDNVEKIEVVHGAESGLYGSDAMDGVIQIFTHRGTTRIPEFTAYTDGGSFSTVHGGAELSGLAGRFDYSGAIADLETQGQGKNDAFRDRTLSGTFGWRFSETAHASLALRDNLSDAGTPGQTLLEPANLCVALPSACEDNTRLHNFSANLHVEFATGKHWSHQLNGTESYFRQFNFDPSFPSLFQDNRSSFIGQSVYQIKGLAVAAGYEYEVENGYVGLHVRRNNQAGFLDLRWQPVARLNLDAGGRAEDNANFGTRVVPRVGASYGLRIAQGAFGDTRLHAAYGQGIVEPRFDQTSGTDPCFPGNPGLAPEESRTVHAGLEQKFASDRAIVRADYFDSRFHDIISFQALAVNARPPGCPLAEFNTNLASFGTGAGGFFNTNLARARGLNTSGEVSVARWLSFSANYTYDPTRVLSVPNNSDPNYFLGSRLIRRPVNSGNINLNASFWRMNWNLGGYFTGQRLDGDFTNIVQVINPGYALFNVAASYRMAHGFSFYGRIANLADKKYSEVYGFPALGREFRIGVKYTTRRE